MAGGFDASRAVGAGLGDWRRVREFITEFAAAWTRPLAPGDGYGDDVLRAAEQRLGVRLPAALCDAYLLFGRRADLTARQDRLLPPDRLHVDHDASVIVFRTENQDCAEWGVAAADKRNPGDPPAFVRRQGGRRWEPFLGRVSLACAEMVLTEVLLGAKFTNACELTGEELIATAESACSQVPLPEYPLWAEPAVTIRWFAAPGKLLRMDGRGPDCWLLAAGQTPADLESIRTTIPGPWTIQPGTGPGTS